LERGFSETIKPRKKKEMALGEQGMRERLNEYTRVCRV
jgi:hypothetical protein